MSQSQEASLSSGARRGYASLLNNPDKFKALDYEKPIVGAFTIAQVPDGMPPEEIRRQWVGVQLPLRRGYGDRAAFNGGVEINPADVILSLLLHDKAEAADWFRKAEEPRRLRGGGLSTPDGDWAFDRTDGTVEDLAPSPTSFDYYVQFVPDAVKKAVDGSREELRRAHERVAALEIDRTFQTYYF